MALPKTHHTKSKTHQRRSHMAKTKIQFTLCPKCHTTIKPHCVCPNCGEYKGKIVIDVLKKLNKKEKKQKQKELKTSGKDKK